MHDFTGYVIKQLVHAFSCALSSYGVRGKFGEHPGSYRLGQLLHFFSALQTSCVLHLQVRDCCECFDFKYTHALTVKSEAECSIENFEFIVQ